MRADKTHRIIANYFVERNGIERNKFQEDYIYWKY